MYRATSPTHTFIFDFDPQEMFKSMLITYAQNGENVIEKRMEDLSFAEDVDDEGDPVYFAFLKLTQEETNRFSTKLSSYVYIQIRALTMDDEAVVFQKYKTQLYDVLNDEVLT